MTCYDFSSNWYSLLESLTRRSSSWSVFLGEERTHGDRDKVPLSELPVFFLGTAASNLIEFYKELTICWFSCGWLHRVACSQLIPHIHPPLGILPSLCLLVFFLLVLNGYNTLLEWIWFYATYHSHQVWEVPAPVHMPISLRRKHYSFHHHISIFNRLPHLIWLFLVIWSSCNKRISSLKIQVKWKDPMAGHMQDFSHSPLRYTAQRVFRWSSSDLFFSYSLEARF